MTSAAPPRLYYDESKLNRHYGSNRSFWGALRVLEAALPLMPTQGTASVLQLQARELLLLVVVPQQPCLALCCCLPSILHTD